MNQKEMDVANAAINLVLLGMQIYQQVSQKNQAEVIADILRESLKRDTLITQMKEGD